MPCEHEGKDQDNAPLSQATPKTARKPPETRRKAHHRCSLILHLISDPWSLTASLQNWETINFWFLSHTQFVVPSTAALGNHYANFNTRGQLWGYQANTGSVSTNAATGAWLRLASAGYHTLELTRFRGSPEHAEQTPVCLSQLLKVQGAVKLMTSLCFW